MVLEVTSGTIATLGEEAQHAAPHECCGLLLGRAGRIEQALRCANVHAQPASHFEIDPAVLIAAHKAARAGGPMVLGYYHSHPNGRAQPSATDRADAARDGRIHAIIANGSVSWWRDSPQGFEPLPTRLVER